MCGNRSGKDSYNWRGGKTNHSAGYIYMTSTGHPRGKNHRSYVFEHILVVEKKLGRYLTKDETVHHKNGVKSDNRLKNLELWTKPHPTGIRAADAIRWARQILKLYKIK